MDKMIEVIEKHPDAQGNGMDTEEIEQQRQLMKMIFELMKAGESEFYEDCP